MSLIQTNMSEPIKSDPDSQGEEEEEQEYNEPSNPEKMEAGDPIKPELSERGEQEELKRSLRSRHLQMIAIGALRLFRLKQPNWVLCSINKYRYLTLTMFV